MRPDEQEETVDTKYAQLIKNILDNGDCIETRNSKVKRTIAEKVTFSDTPLISVRKTAWKNALREWEWFMSGSNNINDLHESVRHWWKPWANENNEVPYNYSKQFRGFHGQDDAIHWSFGPEVVDQVYLLIEGIKKHPYSRRNLITTWNTTEMHLASKLPNGITNCHSTIIQAFVTQEGRLSLVTYQRSCDVICGLPHNWIQMAAFHLWLAARTEKVIGELVWIGGDCHVYDSHTELAKEILDNYDKCQPTPVLMYKPTSDSFKADDFSLDGNYVPIINKKAEMIV